MVSHQDVVDQSTSLVVCTGAHGDRRRTVKTRIGLAVGRWLARVHGGVCHPLGGDGTGATPIDRQILTCRDRHDVSIRVRPLLRLASTSAPP